MSMFRRINPVMVYMVHRFEVVRAFAVGIRFDDLEYIVVPDLRSPNATRMAAENVLFSQHDARARLIKFLEMRLLVERTRHDIARHHAGFESQITDVEYREFEPIDG